MKDIKNLLINEKNIKLLEKKDNTSFNVKKLLGVDVDQSQSIRFGNLFQDFIKSLVTNAGGDVIDVQFLDVYETGNTKNVCYIKDIFNILGIECSKEDYYNLMKEFGAKIQ